MAANKLKKAQGNSATTTLSSSVSNTDTSFPLTSDTAFAGEGMVIIDEGTASEEYAYATGKDGSSLTIPLANRGLEGTSAVAHNSGATIKGVLTALTQNDLIDSLSNVVLATTGALDTSKVLDLSTVQVVTNKHLEVEAPEGFLVNGKIVPSVASNNLTVALKTLANGNPSATDPVYVRIGDTVRAITSALSVTKNAGTNWCNAGGTETATKEIDYFVYLGYNATDGIVIGFSRFPGASIYSDFSTTEANEKYCGISTITTAAAGDNYVVVGRFAATLSGGAGYTWSVPTFTNINLIQYPIYETRWLTAVGTVTASGGTAPTYVAYDNTVYMFDRKNCHVLINKVNSSGGTAGAGTVQAVIALPFACATPRGSVAGHYVNGSTYGVLFGQIVETASTFNPLKQAAIFQAADQNNAAREVHMDFFYSI